MMLFSTRNLNLVLLLLAIFCILFASCFDAAPMMRLKKWYSWNEPIQVDKKWYDWQNVPHALQQKRQLDLDEYS